MLTHDEIVGGWSAVPHQIREFLIRKKAPGAAERLSANPAMEIDYVIFGVHGLETARGGTRYQWMSDTAAEIHVTPRARSVTIPVRHAFEILREPARVRVELHGRRVDELTLDDPEWRFSTIALPRGTSAGPAAMRRIRLVIDRVWYPAQIIRRSQDPRALGLQIGELTIR